MPSMSASSEAESEANKSGAPAPKASKVTPVSDSDSLNVFDIFCKAGDRCSSATKDRQKNAVTSAATCYNLTKTYRKGQVKVQIAVELAVVNFVEVDDSCCLAVE